VVVTEEAAAWVGRALGASREPRVLTLRQQYERTRVVLATATPEAGTVLVVEDQIGQPRTLSWMAENRTTHGHSGKQGWPRAAVIAVATLGLAFVATGATAIWYRTQWKTAEATLLAKPTDQTPTKVPPADAPTPPASPESGKSDTGPSTDFVDDVTGVRFVLVCKIDLSLPEGRNLTVDLPFWAATTEVTVEQFAAFAKAAGHKTSAESSSSTPTWRNAFDSGKLNLPVVYVTPSDAEKFVRWMSDRTGRKIEVPDATRWELAARAGALTRYAFGGGLPSDSGAVFKPKVLSPASTGKPNGAGLIGVHGNVAELARLPDGKWVRLGGSFRSWGRDAAFVDPQKAAEADSQRGDAATGFRPIILGSGS